MTLPGLRSLFLDQSHELKPLRMIADHGIETSIFQHYYRGIEVIGARAFQHLSSGASQIRTTMTAFEIDPNPAISPESAVKTAIAFLGEPSRFELAGEPLLKILPRKGHSRSVSLIYRVILNDVESAGGREILVDAHTREVIAEIPHELPLEMPKIHVRSTKNSTKKINPRDLVIAELEGASRENCQVVSSSGGYPLRYNLPLCPPLIESNARVSKKDASAERAARNAEVVLHYFLSEHQRNSFDDRGSDLVSLVHAGDHYSNAGWFSERKFMSYGDGDGRETGDFTEAVDIAGHEMTHGVIRETANLMYSGESGAVNEAFADFFGKLIANDGDWALGRKVYLDPLRSKGIRNLAYPGMIRVSIQKDPFGSPETIAYPSHTKNKLQSDPICYSGNDYCWVHINSTIIGNAAYRVHKALGRQKSQRIFYTALTQYLYETADFEATSKAIQDSCDALYSSEEKTCDSVRKALDEVGL